MCRLRKLRYNVACVASVMLTTPTPVDAMQYSAVPLDEPNKIVVTAVGEIVPGDFARLAKLLQSLSSGMRVLGFSLDSPGGNLLEAEKLAGGLRRMEATVGVFGQARCVSACFLLFAAGTHRLASPEALLGVHSASEAGVEDTQTMAMTTAMARDAAEFGVPPGIIGRWSQRPPDRCSGSPSAT